MNVRSCMQCAVVVAIGSMPVSAPAVHAQQAWIGLYHSQAATDCHLDSSDSGTHFAYMVLTKTFDFSLISIKATVPPGCTWVADHYPSTMKLGSSGNSQTGCWLVPTGPCIGGPNLTILAIEYSAPSALPPTSWEVAGASTPNIGFFDCGVGFFGGMSITSWINNPGANCSQFQYLAPYFPSPPDDGVNMPTNITLGFHGDANHIWLSTEPFTTPRDADIVCASVGGGPCPNPFDPGLLAPNTQYYWMAGNVCDPPSEDCRDALSEVWTFTTGSGPLAVRPSTWGAMKAIYR